MRKIRYPPSGSQKKNPPLAALLLALLLSHSVCAEPLYSPTWGFKIDLPEEFYYIEGDGRDRFSFESQEGSAFDIAIYPGGVYRSAAELGEDVQRRLGNRGSSTSFTYRNKEAVLMELSFINPLSRLPCEGWGLCVELEGEGPKPLLLALVYGNLGIERLQSLYFSALDSISPGPEDRLAPGPITEYAYPRGERRFVPVANTNVQAWISPGDSEAAQALVDREFAVLARYVSHPAWQEAWKRFYRAIYRDSYDRLKDIAFNLERSWSAQGDIPGEALKWVQSFAYERDLMGSDFVNLVSAAVEGRGDCDSRAMLWAICVSQANIPTAMMVSRELGHAMGLVDSSGPGARFEMDGRQWLVAETTAQVALGLIAAQYSNSELWLGISFE